MTTVGPDRSRTIDEIVLVVRARPAPEQNPLHRAQDAWQSGVASIAGLLGLGAELGSATVQAAVSVGQSAVSSALDRVIPGVVSAVVTRMGKVDLTPVIRSVLDSVDITAIVLERVDIDAIADRVDIERLLDRVPIIDLANYVVDEIDLARIIRESTGGMAVDGVNAVRFQTLNADDRLATVVDAFLLRRRPRRTQVDPPKGQSSLSEPRAGERA